MAGMPPQRANSDTFTAADYNALVTAMATALGITDSAQTYLRPVELRIGGSTVYIKRDSGDGSLIFYDAANPSGKKLKDLIGAAAVPWFIGPTGQGADALSVNYVHLWPFRPKKSCTAIAIRDASRRNSSVWDEVGIYSSGGNLLAKAQWGGTGWSGSDVTSSLTSTLELSSEQTYWLGAHDTTGASIHGVSYAPSLVKRYAASSLPSTLAIPSDWWTPYGYYPFLYVVVQGGMTF